MKLAVTDRQVEGELVYNFYEKDKSKGKLTGSLHGDTLFANYTFISEGIESVREVVFLKRGNEFVEGYSEMDMETGTKFKNRQAIDFSSKTILKEMHCN